MNPSDFEKKQTQCFETCADEANKYAGMITSHASVIDDLCGQIVSQNRSVQSGLECDGFSILSDPERSDPENEKQELFNAALDHLASEDYAVVRKFGNRSKFSTYLASVISRLAIDIARHKRGRSRVKEKAAKMGDVASLLYNLVYIKTYTPAEAQGVLEVSFGIFLPLDTIREILNQMRGSEKARTSVTEGPIGFFAAASADSGSTGVELILPESEKTPEALLADMQRSALAQQAVSEFLGTLNGRDKLMIRMRFPMCEGEEPMTHKEIGSVIGMSEDTVQRNIDRILKDFREVLISRGISLDDLV